MKLFRLKRTQRGIAATEFAMAVPMLLTLLLGGIDLARYMIFNQKAERIAYTIADIVAQSENSPTAGELNQILLGAAQIMQPFAFGANGRVIITSVYRAEGSTQSLVRWRYTHNNGGTLNRNSQIGNVGAVATLPTGLTLNSRDNLIVAEVYYAYQNVFPVDFLGSGEIYKRVYFKPRLGALLNTPA